MFPPTVISGLVVEDHWIETNITTGEALVPLKISTEIPHLLKSWAWLPHLEMKKAAWWFLGNYSGIRGGNGSPGQQKCFGFSHTDLFSMDMVPGIERSSLHRQKIPLEASLVLISLHVCSWAFSPSSPQMRDDLDVDKIFVLSWLWGQILSLFPIVIQRCKVNSTQSKYKTNTQREALC